MHVVGILRGISDDVVSASAVAQVWRGDQKAPGATLVPFVHSDTPRSFFNHTDDEDGVFPLWANIRSTKTKSFPASKC